MIIDRIARWLLRGPWVDAFGLTDTGLVREANEDHFLVASVEDDDFGVAHTNLIASQRRRLRRRAKEFLFLVADGVGGGPGGKVASSLAVASVARQVRELLAPRLGRPSDGNAIDLLGELEDSVIKSHHEIRAVGRAASAYRGMATTLTAVHVAWPTAHIVQVGDSRCYLFRDDRLRQITTDQTVAQTLVDQGKLTREQADESPLGHVLSSAVGTSATPSTSQLGLRRRDVLMLCTDGLTKHVPEIGIADCLRRSRSAAAACRTLVAAALEGGGSDNVTVVVSRF